MELILIRHGESEGNVSGNVYGVIDYPLTNKGKEQAQTIRDILKDKKVDYVYTSPLLRAKVIGQGIALDHDVPLSIETYAMEKNYGDYEDKPVAMLQESMGLEDYYEMINPYTNTYDVINEAGLGFNQRVKDLLNRLIEDHGQTDDVIVLTAHQGVIRVISQVLLNYSPDDMMHYKWEPGCMARFQIKKGFGKLVELIQTF